MRGTVLWRDMEPTLTTLGVYRPQISQKTWQGQWQVTADDQHTREHFADLVLIEGVVEQLTEPFDLGSFGQMSLAFPAKRVTNSMHDPQPVAQVSLRGLHRMMPKVGIGSAQATRRLNGTFRPELRSFKREDPQRAHCPSIVFPARRAFSMRNASSS
jgi:hypothetical protein